MNTQLFPSNHVKQWMGTLLWLLAAFGVAGCTAWPMPGVPIAVHPAPPPTLANGVASGDVSQTGAVLWARSTVTGPITFTVTAEDSIHTQLFASVTDPALPVTTTLVDLIPNTQYHYQVTNAAGEAANGQFRTAAPDGVHAGLRFGVGGDWRGDLAPYPAMANAVDRDLDFFLALGDLMYADIPSAAVPEGPARTLDEFRRKFDEVYATHHGWNTWAELRGSTPLFVTIDDHEVRDNFAGGAEAARDQRFPETEGRINDTAIYENAMQALHEYHPMIWERYGDVGGDGRMDGEVRLYRYRTFGSDAALIVLDARSFRDLPLARPDRHDPDDVARFRQQTFRPDRTMLGAQQLADLKRDLLDAQARGVTWIFVAVPQPVQNRGLISAHDRFEGYAAERTDLLRFIEENGICNVVFIAADIHGTLVNNLTYRTTPDGPDQLTAAFEITVSPAAFNPPLGPVVLQHGLDEGYVTAKEAEHYRSLPVRNDPDSVVDDRDDWVKAKIDEELLATGYDPLGLDGSPIDAQLRQGDYVAVEYYGWTEFEIDAERQALTVTSYGIPPYGRAALAENPQSVLAREPVIVSQFVVQPAACTS